ncbi:MAG: SH3 domain-containing protein [Spirochaetales bacterium]
MVRCSLLLIVLAGLLGSCNRVDKYEGLTLPATPVLTIQTYYGVVDFVLVRVRESPVQDGNLVTMLRAGTIVEIVTSSSSEETIEGKNDRWYQIQFQGRRGWVFGSYLKIFDSLDKARNAAKAAPKEKP